WKLGVFLSLFVTSSAAPLTDPGTFTPEFFAIADKNKDGKIDFNEFLFIDQEYINYMLKQFASMDADGSDSLDVKEFTALEQANKNRYSIDIVKDSSEGEPIIVLSRTIMDDVKKAQKSEKVQKVQKSVEFPEDLEVFMLDDSKEDSDMYQEKNRPLEAGVSDDVFKEHDDDGNGKLNEDELMTYIQDYLEMALKRSAHVIVDRYDANKDGGLDKTELIKFLTELPSELVEDIAGSEEYDFVHDGDDNDYGFAADSIVSDRH
ncbi:hypothetical protein PMAYCL1PPCAC_04291, partial [Pristionchus mayeri]